MADRPEVLERLKQSLPIYYWKGEVWKVIEYNEN